VTYFVHNSTNRLSPVDNCNLSHPARMIAVDLIDAGYETGAFGCL